MIFNKKKLITFTLVFIVLQFPLIDKSYSNVKKVLETKTFLTFYKQKLENNDTIEYNEIIKLFENEDYHEFLKKSLPYLDKTKKPYQKYQLSILIAKTYDLTNNFKESLKYLKKTLKILSANNDFREYNSFLREEELAKTYYKIGAIYQKNKKLDSATYYHYKVIELPGLSNEVLDYKARTYNNLSGYYQLDSTTYDKAEMYALKAIEIRSKSNNKLSYAISLNNLGNIYMYKKDFENAKKVYLEGIDLLRNEESLEAIDNKAGLYYNLAWAMRNLEDYKAYDQLEESIKLEDKVRKTQNYNELQKIREEFQVNQVKRQKDIAENKRLKAQQNFVISIAVSLFVFLVLVYFLRGKNLKQKNLELELQQSELIKNQELEKLKSEAQTRILNATIDGKETERKLIAETLHDSVSTLLSSANLHLQATKKKFNGNTPNEIMKSQEIIQEATLKIRDLSHNLVSSVLLKFGLDFAVRDLCEKFSNSELTILAKNENLRRYHQNFEIKVYNIIQEFINNAIKHSKASNTLIRLSEVNETLILYIADDGIGFDKTKIDSKKGLGINQIDARIQMMQGKFHIESSKENGTQIFVEIPIVEREVSNFV